MGHQLSAMNLPMTQELMERLLHGQSLSQQESQQLFLQVVGGELNDIQIAAAVAALNVRGQTAAELSGAVEALAQSATPFPRPEYRFADVVGTGGDGHNTINLSTIAALTAAAAGAKIVKHGNRSISSCSGSFDLLEKLGIDINMPPERGRKCVDELGICFLFAPQYHAGLKHAAAARRTLKIRTIFNLLGPLVNPARPPAILLGVALPELLETMSDVLTTTGASRSLVVHGSGVDEVAVHGSTTVIENIDGRRQVYEVSPSDFGASEYPLDQLTCHEAEESHERSQAVLEGRGRVAENAAVCVNVALLLKLFDHPDLRANYQTAMDVLNSGQPMNLVKQLMEAD